MNNDNDLNFRTQRKPTQMSVINLYIKNRKRRKSVIRRLKNATIGKILPQYFTPNTELRYYCSRPSLYFLTKLLSREDERPDARAPGKWSLRNFINGRGGRKAGRIRGWWRKMRRGEKCTLSREEVVGDAAT